MAGINPKFIDPDMATDVEVASEIQKSLTSPTFLGTPQAPTPSLTDVSGRIATTQYVNDWTNPKLALKVDKVTGKQLSTEDYTAADKTKLAGIATAATANSTDAQLRDRATHTGTQPITSVTNLQASLDLKVDKVTGKQLSTEDYTTIEKNKLAGVANAATANSTDAQLRDRSTHTGTQPITSVTNLQSSLDLKVDKVTGKQLSTEDYTTAEKTKLAGIATAATANSTDSELRDRATHTGTQASTSIYDFALAVRSTVLTGLDTTQSLVITATDSVLSALGKLQAQIRSIKTSISSSKSADVGGATSFQVVDSLMFAGTSNSPTPTKATFSAGVTGTTTEFAELRLVNSSTGTIIGLSSQFTNTIAYYTINLTTANLPTTPGLIDVQIRKISGAKAINYRGITVY